MLIEPAGFQTPLTSADTVQDACDRAWNSRSPHVFEDYTVEYAKECKMVVRSLVVRHNFIMFLI